MSTQEINVPSIGRPSSDQWLINYKQFLIAAVGLSIIGFAVTIYSRFEYLTVFRGDYSSMLTIVALPLFANIVQIGLFVFAIRSLNKIGEKWVRTLHLSINAIAVVMCLVSLVIILSGFDQIWRWIFANIILQLGNVTVLPIGDIVPWQYLWSNFPNSGDETHPVMVMVRFVVSAIPLALAAYWWDRWNRSTDLSSANIPHSEGRPSLADSSEPPSVGKWLVTLIIMSIPVVNLLALLWWSLSSQTPSYKVNFARASLIILVIYVLIYVILFIRAF